MDRMTGSRWRRGEDLFRPDGFADGIGELVRDQKRPVPDEPGWSSAAKPFPPGVVPGNRVAADVPVENSSQTPLERQPGLFSFRREADQVQREADDDVSDFRAWLDDLVQSEAERAQGEAEQVCSEADRVRDEVEQVWSEAERVRREALRLCDEAIKARQEADEYANNVRAEADELRARVQRELGELSRQTRESIDLHRSATEQELLRRRRALVLVSESAMSELTQRERGLQRAERDTIQRLTNAARDIAHALEQVLEIPMSSITCDIDLTACDGMVPGSGNPGAQPGRDVSVFGS